MNQCSQYHNLSDFVFTNAVVIGERMDSLIVNDMSYPALIAYRNSRALSPNKESRFIGSRMREIADAIMALTYLKVQKDINSVLHEGRMIIFNSEEGFSGNGLERLLRSSNMAYEFLDSWQKDYFKGRNDMKRLLMCDSPLSEDALGAAIVFGKDSIKRGFKCPPAVEFWINDCNTSAEYLNRLYDSVANPYPTQDRFRPKVNGV